MKTEAEIRAHANDLKKCSTGPCPHQHANRLETIECEEGRVLMQVTQRALLWVLGEVPDYDRMVEECAAAARE